jgi:hypothetical protein
VKGKCGNEVARSGHVLTECVEIRSMPGHHLKFYQLFTMPIEETASGSQPVEMNGQLSGLQQLIIRPGKSGGVLTQAEFEISRFCAEEKLK